MALSKLTLSIGLVSVPVVVNNVIGKGSKPSGSFVQEDGTPFPKSDDSPGKRVIGYAREDGTFYVPSEDDLAEIKDEKDGMITLDTFVPDDEIEPAYFDKTYAIKPQPGAEKPFWLIANQLRDLGRSAVGSVVLDKDEKLVFLRYSKVFDCLLFSVGYFDEQVSHALIEGSKVSRIDTFSEAEKKLAEQMMTKVYIEPFIASAYKPERWHKLTALIEANNAYAHGAPRAKGETKPTDAPADLMAQLKASVTAKDKKPAARKKSQAA